MASTNTTPARDGYGWSRDGYGWSRDGYGWSRGYGWS